MTDYWTFEAVMKRHLTQPVYLTSGICESTMDDHVGRKVFKALGLPHGTFKGEFYPLVPAEEKLIDSDSDKGPYGGVMRGYSCLYKGKKYISPSVEVCYKNDGQVFSDESYGMSPDCLYPDEAAALVEANRLADHVRPRLRPIGGDVYLFNECEVDRHTVMFLIPADYAVKELKDNNGVTTFVAVLLGNYQSTPSPLMKGNLKEWIGLDICPYCGGADVMIQENRYEADHNDTPPDQPKDMVCQDIECENCGKMWTAEYRPVAFYTYDGGEFNPEPRPITVAP